MNRFTRLGISDATVRAAGVQRVSHREAIELCGIRYKSDHLEGIAYPYRDPATGAITSWRVRRDHPERDADGTPIAKYLSSSDRKHLYFAPDITKDRLADVRMDVIIVEAESSVLALHDSLARVGKRSRVLVGLGGCWGWRGVVGKTTDPAGTRVDEKGPLPDFDRVAWTGRTVILLFDQNALTNPAVQAARNALTAELKGRGADVFIAALPVFDGNGPDDFGAVYGDDKLWSLIDGARRWSAAAARRVTKSEPSSAAVASSQASTIVELAQAAGAELFHDDQVPYLSFRHADHTETYKLRSRAARGWLVGLYLDAAKKAPGAQGVADATMALEALALRNSDQRVYVRIAATDDGLYLDLADEGWRVVCVTASGWRLIVDPPVKFRRPKGLLALPTPVSGGDLPTLLAGVVHVDARADAKYDLALIASLLVAYLRGRGPYPACILNGEQGTTKTTLTRVVKALIDPNAAPVRSTPRDPRDLMIAAVNNHVLAFDNLSALPDWLSDALCRLSTGGGFSTRLLFTDDEEQIFDAVRPVILNGIPEFATRQDLVGRAVFLTLPQMLPAARKAESIFWRDFTATHPRLLGALLDAVVIARREEPTVVMAAAPRMADFARWVVAAETSLGWKSGEFLRAYTENQNLSIDTALDGDPVAELVRGILGPPLDVPWGGTASDLLAELRSRAPGAKLPKGWPSRARALSDELRRLAPALRSVGVDVTFSRVGHSRRRTIAIQPLERRGGRASAASAASASADLFRNIDEPSPPTRTRADAGDGRADAETHTGRDASATSSAHNARLFNELDPADAADAEKPPRSNAGGRFDL